MHRLERLGGIVNRCFTIFFEYRLAVFADLLLILIGKSIGLSVLAFADGYGGLCCACSVIGYFVSVSVGVGVNIL